LINDRPNRAAAAEAPLDGAQERYQQHTHAAHINTAKKTFHITCHMFHVSN
jgi:hypothetical protein